MSDTVKLVIEIPKNEYEQTCNLTLHDRTFWDNAIRNGIPLDDVKAEIKNKYCAEEEPTIYQMGTNLGLRFAVEILDNIGKENKE